MHACVPVSHPEACLNAARAQSATARRQQALSDVLIYISGKYKCTHKRTTRQQTTKGAAAGMRAASVLPLVQAGARGAQLKHPSRARFVPNAAMCGAFSQIRNHCAQCALHMHNTQNAYRESEREDERVRERQSDNVVACARRCERMRFEL